jgi:hypothetical protein
MKLEKAHSSLLDEQNVKEHVPMCFSREFEFQLAIRSSIM